MTFSLMLATEEIEGERLDEDEVGTFFELLITAGIETTGAAIAHGLVALSEHPDQRDLWKSDFATHAASAVEEMLRWSTPIIHFRRTAVTHTQIAGVDIAAGDKVLVFFNSANRDEAVFDDPHSFEIRRAPNPHLTFGGGGGSTSASAHTWRGSRYGSSSSNSSSAFPTSSYPVHRATCTRCSSTV